MCWGLAQLTIIGGQRPDHRRGGGASLMGKSAHARLTQGRAAFPFAGASMFFKMVVRGECSLECMVVAAAAMMVTCSAFAQSPDSQNFNSQKQGAGNVGGGQASTPSPSSSRSSDPLKGLTFKVLPRLPVRGDLQKLKL
jgi:hypothetical protein